MPAPSSFESLASTIDALSAQQQGAITGGRPLRIAVVANTTWYLYNFRRNLMLYLQALGHELIAVGPADKYVAMLEQDGIRHCEVSFNGAGTNVAKEMGVVLRLRSIFRAHGVDAVLSYTPKGNIYSAFALFGLDGRLVMNVSGLGRVFSRGGLLARLVQRLYQQSFRRAEWVFFQNDEDRAAFIGKGLVRHDKTARLPGSGVDLARFRRDETAMSGANGRADFLFVARLLWDKGIGEYVAAARLVRAAHPGARFRVLGSLDRPGAGAVPAATLQSWVEEGVIEYLGMTDDVRPHLGAADCVVLPSFYREGVPRSLLEAAAMSRPVITTDAAGCRDTVDDGLTGLLCKPRDSADLAEKMCRFIARPDAEREAMGRRARAKMERDFDERLVLDAYSAVLQRMHGSKGPAHVRAAGRDIGISPDAAGARPWPEKT
jgi:glycosyltransferase involved in cell wall biosynthesis